MAWYHIEPLKALWHALGESDMELDSRQCQRCRSLEADNQNLLAANRELSDANKRLVTEAAIDAEAKVNMQAEIDRLRSEKQAIDQCNQDYMGIYRRDGFNTTSGD